MTEELKKRIAVIDAALNDYLPVCDKPQGIIYDAMRYSVFAGGKRLRPMLMWECAKLLGGDWDTVRPFACALEMIHTYSLIHDDLPAMDNDDLRRGMPTSHIKFGEDIAILAGDALLNKAFETVAAADHADAAIAIRAMGVLSNASGTEGMIGGQVIDLKSEGKEIAIAELQHLHLLKTGALIRAACVIGGMLAGADDKELDSLDSFAKALGVAFQIQDDILDVTGDEETLGKPIGSDAEQDKNTYVRLCGLDRSKQLVEKYSKDASEALKGFGNKAEFLNKLTEYLINRNN
ncbi:MAG: polyprenyl synthetase family protein [Clostridia bacterium]|nr:polyprenyl synthetase family protein [Clostridia bacterium]